MADIGKPPIQRVQFLLKEIKDDVGKDQMLNALHHCVELQGILVARFNAILKRTPGDMLLIEKLSNALRDAIRMAEHTGAKDMPGVWQRLLDEVRNGGG